MESFMYYALDSNKVDKMTLKMDITNYVKAPDCNYRDFEISLKKFLIV